MTAATQSNDMATNLTVLEHAIAYSRRGMSVIPVPDRSKNPGFRGWQEMRLGFLELPQHFNGHAQNIGLLTGEPSEWLIDVDLDHVRAIELADDYLPPTSSEFGRPSKPRSHRIYRVTAPIMTKKYRSKSAGMIVELRSSGAQTVIPPSTHETGEPIRWTTPWADPAEIAPQDLQDAVKNLANAVLVELGEKNPPRPSKAGAGNPPPHKQAKGLSPESAVALPHDRRYDLCLTAMKRMKMADHHDGSSRLFAAACRVVEHDLSDKDGVHCIRAYAKKKAFPRNWTDAEILQRIRDAEHSAERGAAVTEHRDEDGLISLGTRDPATGKLVLSPKRTLPTAEAFIKEYCTHPEGPTLHSYAGGLMAWRNNHYMEVEEGALRHKLQPWLHDALRYIFRQRSQTHELVPFESNPQTVNGALESLRAHTHLPATITPPVWLTKNDDRLPARELLACKSLNLHLPTMTIVPTTPDLFVTSALDFDYQMEPDAPEEWIRFLEQLWGDDLESVSLLQEWMGYCLTGDTSLQKMLLIVGPKRSGKGTIARVLRRLVGWNNVVGPTTSSLAGPFGLQPLIGKTLAVVSDARFSGENIATVVERLLCISGEDTLTVDRKFRGSVTMKLPTRFMFLSNELPRMNDASGALANRFLVLKLNQCFFGQEDPHLTDKLLLELPGILQWAIEGWKRLYARGHFEQPEASLDAIREMEDLSSPVGAFVRDVCVVGAGHRVYVDTIFGAWNRWCQKEGRTHLITKQTFGRDLAAVVPGLNVRRHREQGRFYEGIDVCE